MFTMQASLETDDPSFCGIFSTVTNTNNPEETTKLIQKKIHCRFCAEIKNYHNELLYISENDNDYEKFNSMLSFFGIDFIDLSETNSLPKTICETCYISFHEAFVFFNKVKQSQVVLSNLYNGSLSEPESCPVKLEPENDENNTLSHEITPFHTVLYQKNKPKIEDQENDDAASLNVECEDTFPTGAPIISESPIVLPSKIELVAPSFDILQDQSMVSPKMDNVLDNSSDQENDDAASLNVECEDTFPTGAPIISESPIVLPSKIELVAPSFDILQDQSMVSPKMDNVQDNSSDMDVDDKRDDDKEIEIKPKEKVLVPSYNGIPIFKTDGEKGSWTSYCWRCKWCNTLFRTSDDLRCHGKEVHATCFAFECSDCVKEYNTFFEFIEHVREHRSHLKNYCKYCNHRFDTAEKCVTHEISHRKGHKIECELCGELCANSGAFARHKGAPPKETNTEKPKRVYKGQRTIDKKLTWENYKWTCQECLLRAPTVGSLRDHVKEVHNKCFAMKCTDCIRVMTSYRMFVEHVRKHRPYLRNYCKYCDQEFDTAEKCIAHEISHTKGNTIPCELCGELCPNSNAYVRHKEPVPKEKITRRPKPVLPKLIKKIDKYSTWENYEWTCQECLLRAPTVGSLRDHVREVHNKCFAMKCMDCEDVMMNFKMFVEHVKKHRPHLRRWCLYCNKEFPTLKNLSFHIAKHYEGRSLCRYCGEIFADKCSLKEHLVKYSKRRNPEDILKRTCTICNKVFVNGSAVPMHIRLMHSDIKPTVICPFCGKNVSESYIDQHIRQVHDSKRDFECDICHQKFPLKAQIKSHILFTHLKIKRYQCDVCGKKFGKKYDINKHKQIHTDQLPFSCNMCDKAFRTKANMTKHFLQHTGEKPYECDFCYKSFTCTGNRQKHMLRIHKQEKPKRGHRSRTTAEL